MTKEVSQFASVFSLKIQCGKLVKNRTFPTFLDVEKTNINNIPTEYNKSSIIMSSQKFKYVHFYNDLIKQYLTHFEDWA